MSDGGKRGSRTGSLQARDGRAADF